MIVSEPIFTKLTLF